MKEQIAIGISLRPDGSIYVHGMDSKDVTDWTREHGRSLAIQLVNTKNGRVEANMFMAPKSTPILLDESETARITEKSRQMGNAISMMSHCEKCGCMNAFHGPYCDPSDVYMQDVRKAYENGVLEPAMKLRAEKIKAAMEIQAVLNTPVSEVMAKVEQEPPAMDVPAVIDPDGAIHVGFTGIDNPDQKFNVGLADGDRLDPPQELEPPKRVNWKEFL